MTTGTDAPRTATAAAPEAISLTVNGTRHRIDAARGEERLLDFLHEELDLTGTKFCCGIGICRACTVKVVRPPAGVAEPVIACSTALRLLDGAEVSTVESLAQGEVLDPVQEAFLRHFAFQCGYCTPGFAMAARMFLDWLETAPLTEAELPAAIETALGSHVCRCSGYVRYHAAVAELALAVLARKAVTK